MTKIDRTRYEYRNFIAERAFPTGNGTYRLSTHTELRRNKYTMKRKKGSTEWPSVSQTASKVVSKLCGGFGLGSKNSKCVREFVLRETTNGMKSKNKIWFFRGESVPYSKNKVAEYEKKKKAGKMMFVPRRHNKVGLVSPEKLGHQNPLPKKMWDAKKKNK